MLARRVVPASHRFMNVDIDNGIVFEVGSFTETFLIKFPSFQEYSALTSYPTLQCSCSKIGIKYEEFLEINVVYNELCESDLISDEWIDYLFILYEQSWNNSLIHDFRRIAIFQFQTLQALCYLVQNTIENTLQIFYLTEFTQSKLISSNSFHLRMDTLITEFIHVLSKTFIRKLHFMQNITAQSLIMTGASLTSALPNRAYRLLNEYTIPFTGINYTFLDGLNCTCSSSTSTNCLGLATFENDIIPGFQTGCYMINALLQSTLQAFHNQTFINVLTTNSSKTFRKLNLSLSSSTIEILLSQLFVSQWLNTTSYERYYNHCLPDLCQYTMNKKYHFLHVITVLIGLFGGLSSVIRIFAPFLIRIVWYLIKRQQRNTQIEGNVIRNRHSLHNRMILLFQWCKQKLITLNFFQKIPPTNDEDILQQERLFTRIYLLLISIALIILILFNLMRVPLTTFTVESPSLSKFLQLYNQYSSTLNCPCSQNTIKYSEFIFSFEPQYHEICSSEFVSLEWINMKFIKSPSPILPTHDFRSQSQVHFQLLSTLCYMSKQIIAESLHSFYQKELITHNALSSTLFQLQINLILEQVQKTTLESFQSILQLIKSNLEINQFLTSRNSEFFFAKDDEGNRICSVKLKSYRYYDKPGCASHMNSRSQCICNPLSTNLCYMETMITDNTKTYIIPGMLHTWFPFQSVLISTLECLYNHTCLSYIKQFINSTSIRNNFTTLKSLSSDDNRYIQIESLANNLFVQSWNNQSSFQSYFNQCRPLICQYTTKSRLQMISIFTMILGLIGGLNIILRLLTPIIVKLIHKIWKFLTRRLQNQPVIIGEPTSIRLNLSDRFYSLKTFIRRNIIELNLFTSIPPTQNITIIRQTRRQTRIYLILLITALCILLLYASLKQQTNTFVIRSPTVSQYKDLLMQSSSILQCPCNHTAIKYERFISELKPQYHQICSSMFNTPEWYETLKQTFDIYSANSIITEEYRDTIGFQFQIVSFLCNLTQKIVNSSLFVFEQTDFFTKQLISPVEFQIQTETLFNQFKNTIANEFMQTLKLMQTINRGNQLATGFKSNWLFILQDPSASTDFFWDASFIINLLTRPITYGIDNCSCAIDPKCSMLSHYLFQTSSDSLIQILPGFRVGCLTFDAFLQSSFVCLYNQTCLDLLQSGIFYGKPVPVKTLTNSQTIRSNTTIETILSRLFVSEWFYKTSYDLYFNECAPQSCQYSYSMKFNQVYVITTLIALTGGLTKGLHMLVSCVSWIFIKLYYFRKKKREVIPNEQHLNTLEIECNSINTTITTQIPQIDEMKNRKERAFVIGLILWILIVIITLFIVWLVGNNHEHQLNSITPQTTITISQTLTDLTIPLNNTCLTTLNYQSYTYSTGRTPKSLVIDDFNNDGTLDLVVTNYQDHSISVLLGHRNGTFQTQKIFSMGADTYPLGITTGDFNNDTLSDIAVTLSGANQVAILYNVLSNDLLFSPPLTLIFSKGNNIPDVIESADFDRNGFEDFVVGNQVNKTNVAGAKFVVFLNLGNGYDFTSICGLLCTLLSNVISIAIGDFSHDGKQNDLSLCDINGNVLTFRALNYSNMRETLQYNENHMYKSPLSLIRGKLNYDDFDDLAMISPQSNTLQILLAYDEYSFIEQTYLTSNHPTSVAKINFNHDNIDDLVVLHCNRTINVFIGTNIGLFNRNYLSYEMHEEHIGQCAQSIKVADFNNDGRDDLVFVDTETDSIRVLLDTNCHE